MFIKSNNAIGKGVGEDNIERECVFSEILSVYNNYMTERMVPWLFI